MESKMSMALGENLMSTVLHNHFNCGHPGPCARSLTCVLEVDVIAVVCILQFVGHHSESHDLLSDESVGPGDVHLHLRVVDLVGQPIIHDLR